MLRGLLLFSPLLISNLSFANDSLICVGGLKSGLYTTTIELHPDEDFESLLEGTLPTEDGALQFYVQKQNQGYYFKAQKQNPPFLFISEKVPSLPAVRSKKINESQEIFIDCKTY
ncbi:MAG: hypothetical protein ACXVB1_18205 [Pseudobdellovibrionaceae bacterium]